MKSVTPEVFLISRPNLLAENLAKYLDQVGGRSWLDAPGRSDQPGGESLVEFGGRLCYRSWEPGLNANVTRVRTDSTAYLANVIASQHGSVLEHSNYSFIFHNVSRVFTHELVRHRAGVAISQESLRFVRLNDLPVWWPEWAKNDPDVMARTEGLVEAMEEFQGWAADHFGLDDVGRPFHDKKEKTSFMRRFAPDGIATGMLWTANLRTLRHVIEMRTADGAEEEIRLVFGRVAEVMREQAPAIFADYTVSDTGAWVPGTRKA